MPSIKARLAALTETVQSWKGVKKTPYEELDPISKALVDAIAELEAMSDQDKQAMADENNMTLEGVEKMIQMLKCEW